MANVSHASLTGSNVHEPKGITGAALGTVYVSDGAGSGSWSNIGTSSFTGMIADFTWPVAQTGWLELNGAVISATTYAGLYAVMTIQMNGTRISGSPIISSLTSTGNMRAGYYVYGTGIAAGTTIATIDSVNQITLSGNASSSGTATVIVSPWLVDSGTIKLPDVTTAGRFRRSRSGSAAIGQLQASTNIAHTHGVTGVTGFENASHVHLVDGNTGVESVPHTHTTTGIPQIAGANNNNGGGGGTFAAMSSTTGSNVSGNPSVQHTHHLTLNTGTESANHAHNFTTTSDISGGTESRPPSIVVMTCVKT